MPAELLKNLKRLLIEIGSDNTSDATSCTSPQLKGTERMKDIEVEYFQKYLNIADSSINSTKSLDHLHEALKTLNGHYIQKGLPLSKIKKTLPADSINIPVEWNEAYEGWITSQIC